MKLFDIEARACAASAFFSRVLQVVRDHIFTKLYDIFASQDSSRYFDPGPFAFAADYEARTGLPSPFASNTLEDERDSGPLKRAALDKSFVQLSKAAFFGLDDRLEDPVASCMVGLARPCDAGPFRRHWALFVLHVRRLDDRSRLAPNGAKCTLTRKKWHVPNDRTICKACVAPRLCRSRPPFHVHLRSPTYPTRPDRRNAVHRVRQMSPMHRIHPRTVPRRLLHIRRHLPTHRRQKWLHHRPGKRPRIVDQAAPGLMLDPSRQTTNPWRTLVQTARGLGELATAPCRRFRWTKTTRMKPWALVCPRVVCDFSLFKMII